MVDLVVVDVIDSERDLEEGLSNSLVDSRS